MKILGLDDFQVPECVTHHYEKDGRWFWGCLTCDTGSGKRTDHLRGHRLEGDAAVGAKYHRNAKRMERRQRCQRSWWWREVMTTRDLEYFMALWNSHLGFRSDDGIDWSDVMASVQSDNRLWDYMTKLNPGFRERVS